jgi:SAM-dependent methyltransferase
MTGDMQWTPGKLMEMSGSYWQASTLHAAVKLDVFTKIDNGTLDADGMVQRSGCDRRGIVMLLNALSALGLLIKKGDAYENTGFAKSHLCKTSNAYIGHMVMHHHHLVEAWSHLDQAVQSGRPVRESVEPNEVERQSFLMGMFNNAMAIAPNLVKGLDLKGRMHLLDLGGGPGTYAIHFCLANPDMQATIFDLSTTSPYALETVGRFGLSDRIGFVAGDVVSDEIPGSYDVVWVSHLLHALGPEACRTIIQKAVSVLRPGGSLLVHEFILDNTLDGPIFPAIFSLNMLVNTEEGQSYSEADIMAMLSAAGLRDIKRLPFKGPTESGIIQGEKSN